MLLARSYSHHSLLSAVPKIKDLLADAKTKGYTAVALTDEDTGSGFVEFYDECLQQGIQPVLGVTLRMPNVALGEGGFGRHKQFSKVALLAKNFDGYKALLGLITVARTLREDPVYHLQMEDVSKALSASGRGFFCLLTQEHEIVHLLAEARLVEARKVLSDLVQTLGSDRILLELCMPDPGLTQVAKINRELVGLCREFGLRYIASPAPRYLNSEDSESFRTILAIREGKRLFEINLQRDFSLPEVSGLAELFSEFPQALDVGELLQEIDIKLRTDFDKYASEAYFPKFALEEGESSPGRLAWEAYIGLLERFHPSLETRAYWKQKFPYADLQNLKDYVAKLEPDPGVLPGYPRDYWGKQKTIQDYIQRVETELDVIIQKGYPDYFLVFGDIMQFCRDNGIVINTRGSAAGCLVGYLININILDPLLYTLPFERFLNPLRPSAPDIDGDFADDKRDKVIAYITDKYGKDKVCQIITFGTMLPRAAVRDVGRVLGVSYRKCDRLSKLIPIAPQGKKTTFAWAFSTSEELKQVYEQDEESRRIIDIAQKIEGNYRHASVHAAGVIIAPTAVTEYAPLQWDSDHQMIICQYDMRVAEKAGLIKMDILGIRNLAILGNAVELAEKRRQQKIDLLNVSISDRKSFELLSKGRTMGTFQLSGPAMTRYLVQLEPSRVEDLMAMVALYRPGPMDSIPEYIQRKKNPKLIRYVVPQMEKWMQASNGIFVYQEDLLYTAVELAGYDWGRVDVLRKGMGKKIQAVIDEQHPIFVRGCVEYAGLPEEKAEEIWSLMVPFGAYGFNKAHSSSYGMIAYWTAYMKANYPAEFMTALMTAESGNMDKIAAAIKECEELGLRVLPPDVNRSVDTFSIQDDDTIRYGLGSVKNLGSDVIRFLIENRQEYGMFADLEDFLERMSSCQGFNKRSLEALIWAGCLDELGGQQLDTLEGMGKKA